MLDECCGPDCVQNQWVWELIECTRAWVVDLTSAIISVMSDTYDKQCWNKMNMFNVSYLVAPMRVSGSDSADCSDWHLVRFSCEFTCNKNKYISCIEGLTCCGKYCCHGYMSCVLFAPKVYCSNIAREQPAYEHVLYLLTAAWRGSYVLDIWRRTPSTITYSDGCFSLFAVRTQAF